MASAKHRLRTKSARLPLSHGMEIGATESAPNLRPSTYGNSRSAEETARRTAGRLTTLVFVFREQPRCVGRDDGR
jgi:hypothetical protein